MTAGHCEVAIIGAGPAGLMAAEVCATAGLSVHVFDAMPSAGRKFLLAGLGGLNITHSEPADRFLGRYAGDQATVGPWLQAFDAPALRAWVHALGVSTFVGSSGRVFPEGMKAAPLLRAWLARLRRQGVSFHMRHRLVELSAGRQLTFASPQPLGSDATPSVDVAAGNSPPAGHPAAQTQVPSLVTHAFQADAVVLACGGASWPRLGSDAAWAHWLPTMGVDVTPLQAANCGFDVRWSPIFLDANAGAPIKNVRAWVARAHAGAGQAVCAPRAGEMMISDAGIEGGLVYALSRTIREVQAQGDAVLMVDLLPQHDLTQVRQALARGRGAKSWSSFLGSALGLKGVRGALLRECAPAAVWSDVGALAEAIKALPVPLGPARPLAEAISTAGGVALSSLDDDLQCRSMPGVFCAGEMLDWDAPTGGYLLTAVMASGRQAGQGVVARRQREAARLGADR